MKQLYAGCVDAVVVADDDDDDVVVEKASPGVFQGSVEDETQLQQFRMQLLRSPEQGGRRKR
jgi:hypothetical protein